MNFPSILQYPDVGCLCARLTHGSLTRTVTFPPSENRTWETRDGGGEWDSADPYEEPGFKMVPKLRDCAFTKSRNLVFNI